MPTLSGLKNYCSGKSVILLGNSVAIFDKANGEDIDGFDVVVRMNDGYPGGKRFRDSKRGPRIKEFIGERTDIWLCSLFDEKKQLENYPLFGDLKFILRLTKNRERVHEELRNKFYFIEEKEYERIRRKIGIDKNPTTGCIAIIFFLETVATQKSLTITGYDFFARRQWIHKMDVHKTARNHQPELEKVYVENLIKDGVIKRIA